MLAIRMQRKGRAHYPTYRIVVQESQRHPLSGRVVAEVGNYNPQTKALTLDKELVEKYLGNGAQPSKKQRQHQKKKQNSFFGHGVAPARRRGGRAPSSRP